MITPIYFNSSELKTLSDFLNDENLSPAFSYRDKPLEFLQIVDNSGKSNYQKILSA
jgi:hypothetical protein